MKNEPSLIKKTISILSLPKFNDDEQNRIAKIVYILSISISIGFMFLVFQRTSMDEIKIVGDLYVITTLLICSYTLLILHKLKAASYCLLFSLFGFVFYMSFNYGGINDTTILVLPGILVIAGLILNKKEFYFTTISAIIALVILGYLEINNLIVVEKVLATTFSDVFDRIITIALTSICIRIFSEDLLKNLKKVKIKEKEIKKRAEEVAASEERFRGLFESSFDPTLLMDGSKVFIDCNQAALNILKFDNKNSIIGKNVLSISPEFQQDGKSSVKKSEIMLSDTNDFGNNLFEWVHVNSKGGEFIVEVSMSRLNINNQNLFLIHWRDITERKKFEAEIREKQLFIERITEQSPDIIYIYDVEIKQNIYTNKDIIKYLGYDNSNIGTFNTKYLEQLIHPEDLKQFENYHEKVLNWSSEYVFEFEYRMKARNGEWRWFVGKEKEFQKENGKIITIIGTIREITENKKTEKELLKEKIFNESVLDSVPGIFYIYDDNGNLLRWNKNHEILTGYSAQELYNKNIVDWFDEMEKGKVLNEIQKAFTSTKADVQASLITKNNEKLPYYFTGVRMKIDDKFYLVGYGIDISERLESEKAIKFSEEKFSKAFQASPVSMNITRLRDGMVLDVNKTFENMTGYTRDEIINKKAADLGIWVDNINKTVMANLLLENKKIEGKTFQFKDKNNKIHISKYSADIIELDGELCALALVVDITEQFNAEVALKESESKFLTIFQTNPNILIVSSLEDNTIVEINNTALKVLNLGKNEIIGKTYNELNLLEKEKREYLLSLLKMHGYFAGIELRIKLTNDLQLSGLFYGQQIEINNSKFLFLTIVDITELKKVGSALKKSEEMYRTLMENMNEAVIQVDNDDKILYVNKNFEKVLGYSSEEIVGKIGYEVFLDSEEQYVIKENNINRQKNLYEQYEIRFKHKNGTKLDFLVSASPICEVNDVVVGSIGVMTDITERKKAEMLLKSSEEKFRLLAENSTDLISVQSMDGKFKYLSPSCFPTLGYTAEELIGKTPSVLLSEADTKVLDTTYKSQQFYKNSYTLIYQIKRKDGKYIWLESTSTIIRDIYDIPKEIQTLSRDITKRKQIEQELEDAIKFIKYVINSLPIALISTDSFFDVTLSNNTANKYLNSDSKHTNNLYLLYPILLPLMETITRAINNREIVEEIISNADENGEMKHVKFVISPIDRLNQPGCVILIDDVTNTRNMEQLMIQSEKMLSVAGLAAGMAHEINNPLGTIVQGCQNILRRVSDQLPKNIEIAEQVGIDISKLEQYFQNRQIFEIIDSMRSASSKAADIIKNMLQFSRRSESKRVMYNIEKLLDQTNELANNDYDFKKKYDFKNINIIKQYEQNLPEIKITVTEMEQVVFNLIRNAVQALRDENNSHKTPTITLRTSKDDKFVKIEIEDNGPGISDKVKKRIFEPFFTTKEVGEGTGLGLSVSYMIVTTNHNGLIEVDSKLGVGTKFTIKLPI